MSISRTVELEQKQGGRKLDRIGGYFTCLRAIRGKTPQAMEELLGFQPGLFASGVVVFRFQALPSLAQFELRGYTQLPGGESFDGIVVRQAGARRPEFFSPAGGPLNYIPGLGVEQWELSRGVLLPAFELQRVAASERFTEWQRLV